MKQILQHLKTGETQIIEIPCPAVQRGQVLIRSSHTLISAGTERMLVEFGKANWIEKARQQPDKVRMVLDKIKTDGLIPTIDAVFNKLDQPLPLGYCNVGRVLELGTGVSGFSVGDRIASNGKHAEVVNVPFNLCAKVPANVGDEEAAFTVVAAIGLQGIRLVQPTLGETIVVIGLGLIGLLTVQLLRAQGCRVLGIDFDAEKLTLAQQFGAEVVNISKGEDPISTAKFFSRHRGVDAVIITASTKSNDPVHQAAHMCRKRGRIVLIGVTGLELSRADFYEKELSFQVSCSYGPGRYDPNYEEKGFDYPVGFVRWTEQRNFEAVLDMMATGRMDVKPLISHRFAINDAQKAYELVSSDSPSMGILLKYPTSEEKPESELRQTKVKTGPFIAQSGKPVLAFIGSGNYSTAVLVPAFKKTGVQLKMVASNGGVSGTHVASKFGFEQTTTDIKNILEDSTINTVVITTRHDSHAQLVCKALDAGKHVFVEKPLALTLDQLQRIESSYHGAIAIDQNRLLMVGFNRRFAPQVQKIKLLMEEVKEPKVFIMTVNAGYIPADHWTQDPLVGGGRIIGEACHFVDLLRFLSGQKITKFQTIAVGKPSGTFSNEDKSSITLQFEDGSIGTILYLANGNKSFPKERLEIFAAGRTLQLDNFCKLKGFGWPGFSKMNLWRQNKGQRECSTAFVKSIEQGTFSPIAFEELMEVSRITIEIAESLR